jgi:regulation of enolase protein 1 (concanavalin A-like superfamily)
MIRISSIPATLEWKNKPVRWEVISDNSISIEAGESSEWFIDPSGNNSKDNAPCAMFTPPDDCFILSAKLKVGFAATFDAGAIQIQENENNWAKFCFEFTPQGKPSIVSVVTRGVSDDCNSVLIDGNEVYLRIAVNPKTISFHYSTDGKYWDLVRYFALERTKQARVGLSSQSPSGKGCETLFSEISYRQGELKDNRSGE